ncbi:hypothetical protein ABEG17_05520 [Pedococcus sp. KACC 23699]|uniref:Uncharacterized protein n=1 Tax=Pedococcus sp. KACC 23699 TaxID=3149228 RepID=A0AAU7JX04_9MICO
MLDAIYEDDVHVVLDSKPTRAGQGSSITAKIRRGPVRLTEYWPTG